MDFVKIIAYFIHTIFSTASQFYKKRTNYEHVEYTLLIVFYLKCLSFLKGNIRFFFLIIFFTTIRNVMLKT